MATADAITCNLLMNVNWELPALKTERLAMIDQAMELAAMLPDGADRATLLSVAARSWAHCNAIVAIACTESAS